MFSRVAVIVSLTLERINVARSRDKIVESSVKLKEPGVEVSECRILVMSGVNSGYILYFLL